MKSDFIHSIMLKLMTPVFLVLALLGTAYSQSAANVALDIFNTCLSQYSTSCIKPKALSWISNVYNQDSIPITDDLSIVRTAASSFQESRANKDDKFLVVDRIDDFLATHTLKIRVPQELSSAAEYVPRSLLRDLPEELDIPLAEGNVQEGRGFVKKVMIPFLLGLKFKASVLVPLALALIALKTWKALTLGLISLVLSGAMVIFKFTKPKIVNYEVIHYPQHHEHHIEHVPVPGWEPHGPYRARSMDSHEMAYGAQH